MSVSLLLQNFQSPMLQKKKKDLTMYVEIL